MLRRVPPVHSPLSLAALSRGMAAALSRRAWRAARAEIDQWIRETFDPRAWAWTDSGTTALTLALQLAVADRGTRRIALPAYGCYDLATACDGAEVEVLLYDIDPETLGPDWRSLEWALAEGARTIVVAYLYGMPVDLERVRSLAAAHQAVIIEDAAQGIGGSYAGRPLGANGDLAVLSFGRGKGLTAGGGGALLAGSVAFAAPVRELEESLPPAGRGVLGLLKSAVQWALARPAVYWIPAGLPFLGLGETIYRRPHPAGRMTRGSAGVLAVTSRLVGREAEGRRCRARALRELLSGVQGLRMPLPPLASEPGYLRFPVFADAARRSLLLSGWGSGGGVGRGYPTTLRSLRGFRALPALGMQRGCDREVIVEQLLTLPVHSLASVPQGNVFAGLVSGSPRAGPSSPEV